MKIVIRYLVIVTLFSVTGMRMVKREICLQCQWPSAMRIVFGISGQPLTVCDISNGRDSGAEDFVI